MAIDYGCTGPVLRGSGVDWDLRRDGEPIYTRMYEGYKFEVIAQVNGNYPHDYPYPAVPREAVLGDCWHRFYVRMLEVVQSMKLIRQAMEKYGQTKEVLAEPIKLRQKLPAGTAYLETEAPKGQMGFMIVSDGTPVPWRVRIRSSSFCNLSVASELCRGMPDCRRAGGHRLAGYRVGGDRSVGEQGAGSREQGVRNLRFEIGNLSFENSRRERGQWLIDNLDRCGFTG